MKLKRPNMKKVFATLTFISLAFAASLTYSLMSGHSTSAKSAYSPSSISAAPAASSAAVSAAAQTTGVTMPITPVFALNADNVISVLVPGTTSFVRLVRVTQANGNLIGIDFRPGDGKNTALYALADTGTLYTINLTATGLGAVTQVSNMTTRFPSGVQSLMDFNPVVNALRLIGSDTLNYAVVNNAGNLNAMAIQTSLTYGATDVNRGRIPKVSAGTYDTNVVGAAATRFYAIDYDLDTFLTIQPATAGGSSATAGGVLQTLGPLVSPTGQRINVSSTADTDIYTTANGINNLVGVSGRTFFTINLAAINPAVAPGGQTNIVTNGITMPDDGNLQIDVAAAPLQYQAENGTQGGGNTLEATNAGFIGTGYVNFADNVAGGFTSIQVNQNGTKTLIFRYANGGAVNRPCNVTVNGVSAGTVAFAPTGAFTTYRTVTLPVNLGTGGGFREVRVTSTTPAGGPNLDQVFVN
jgi:uncharacterized protein DUF4394/alpha-galactosidase-like CBM13-containing protein